MATTQDLTEFETHANLAMHAVTAMGGLLNALARSEHVNEQWAIKARCLLNKAEDDMSRIHAESCPYLEYWDMSGLEDRGIAVAARMLFDDAKDHIEAVQNLIGEAYKKARLGGQA